MEYKVKTSWHNNTFKCHVDLAFPNLIEEDDLKTIKT